MRVLPLVVVAASACSTTLGDLDTRGDADAIDAYLRGLPHLPTEEPGVAQGDRSVPARQGDYQCTTQSLSETRQFDRIVAYAANSDALWPGAIVAGDSVYDGLFAQVGFERDPLTVSVSLENLAGRKSAVLEEPSLASYREALATILDSELDGATPANIYSEIEEVHSQEQLALALGAEVSWLGSAASIAASFDFQEEETRSRYLVKFTQAYYTVDLDAPARPSDVFAGSVTLADVQAKVDARNPPLYVASVTYGRMVVFTFESAYSAEELNAALEFAYAGGVDVSGDVSVTYKDIISSSRITAFILGGSGGEAARTIDSYEALIAFIKDGGNYARESPGAPIAYKLAYLKDNAPGRLSLTTDYHVTDCVRVSQRIKVTLVNLRVESAGGDAGGDLELFGRAWAHGTSAATLLDKTPGTHVVIREGTAWPQGAFVSEAILDVRPEPGAAIELGADLWDYDPIGGDDAMGREVARAAFEAGWRRDVTVLLTGDGARVTATFRLQPI
ncbi:MAG: thiol-activated cytolysin family protein [Deltaproteobacteria bacterium]|nr:thiol-activated cytolysin family protein [Kofleriaceae bacterium]